MSYRAINFVKHHGSFHNANIKGLKATRCIKLDHKMFIFVYLNKNTFIILDPSQTCKKANMRPIQNSV